MASGRWDLARPIKTSRPDCGQDVLRSMLQSGLSDWALNIHFSFMDDFLDCLFIDTHWLIVLKIHVAYFLHKLKFPSWKPKQNEHVLLFWGDVLLLVEVEQSEPGSSWIEFLCIFSNKFFGFCRYVHQSDLICFIAHVTFSVCLLIGEGYRLYIGGLQWMVHSQHQVLWRFFLWQFRSNCLFFFGLWGHIRPTIAHIGFVNGFCVLGFCT